MNYFRLSKLALLGGLLLASGCGRKTAEEAEAPGMTSHPVISPRIVKCVPGVPGGRLTLLIAGQPQTFNPMLVRDFASDEVTRLIFATLVVMNQTTQTLEPGLAESWTVAPDGKTWTFKLRPGLYWSDGEPLTADDVLFTWQDVVYNAAFDPSMYEPFMVDGKKFTLTKVDALTVQVVTPEVYAPFLEFFGLVPILPGHVIGKDVRDGRMGSVYNLATPPAKIVGSGPFRVRHVEPGIVILERNPEYWSMDKKGQRLPYLNEVIIGGARADMTTKVFLMGNGDVYEQTRPQDYYELKTANTNGQFQILELGPGMERDYLSFNQNTGVGTNGAPLVAPERLKWFRNQKFRQALACAIDRERIAREAYQGRAQAAYGLISTQNQKWANTNVPAYTYDLVRARALLAEIGMTEHDTNGTLKDADGKPVEFALESNGDNLPRARSARLIAEDLQKLGIKVEVQLVDFATMVHHIDIGRFDAVLVGGATDDDPATQMNVLKSNRPWHQWFPNQKTPATEWEGRIDKLMDAQMRTLDYTERKKLFDEVQLILAEQEPMISTVTRWQFAAVRPGITNLAPSLSTPYHLSWNLEELYLTQPEQR